MAKRGTFEHRKTGALARALGCQRWAAFGLLECLWHWTARQARTGLLPSDWATEFADHARWDGDPEDLRSALVATGWIDHGAGSRDFVHDWQDHADDSVKKTLANNRECFMMPDGSARAPFEKRNSSRTDVEDEGAPSVKPLEAFRIGSGTVPEKDANGSLNKGKDDNRDGCPAGFKPGSNGHLAKENDSGTFPEKKGNVSAQPKPMPKPMPMPMPKEPPSPLTSDNTACQKWRDGKGIDKQQPETRSRSPEAYASAIERRMRAPGRSEFDDPEKARMVREQAAWLKAGGGA